MATFDMTASSTAGVGATLTISGDTITAIDGVTLTVGDRIVIKDETTTANNGIYTYTSTTVLTRATDFDADSEVTGGAFFFAEEGTTNADNGFVLTNDGAITVGTTALTFTQFSGAGQINAGAALTKSGNQIDVAVDDSSVEVNADALRVKASGITNAMLAGSIANEKLAGSIANSNLANSSVFFPNEFFKVI